MATFVTCTWVGLLQGEESSNVDEGTDVGHNTLSMVDENAVVDLRQVSKTL